MALVKHFEQSVRNSKLISTVMAYIMLNPRMLELEG